MTPTKVETFAGYRRSVAVANNINSECHHATWSSYGGLHVTCLSTDEAKRASMEPNPSFCILHALMVKDQEGEFICPAGITPEHILELERNTVVNY